MGRPRKDANTVKAKNPTSKVWRHYGDSRDGIHAFCLLCKEKDKEVSIKVGDSSTKALRNHLMNFHKKHWKDIQEEESKVKKDKAENVRKATQKDQKNVTNQPNVMQIFNKLTKIDPNGHKQERYDRSLLELS